MESTPSARQSISQHEQRNGTAWPVSPPALGAVVLGAAMLGGSLTAFAQDVKPELNSGDTAWMLTSTALVLFMTIPGLALFYGGLVRTKNVLSVLMQCFVITCLVTVLWTVFGYSMAFGSGGEGIKAFVGGFDKVFGRGVNFDALWQPATTASNAIPETVFFCFQLTFAIITPALIVGAFAERMKFSALLWFMGLWAVFIYNPVAHMVWGGKGCLIADWGALDYAGGTVVHLNAGIAALMCALVLGKRKGYPASPMPPHNLTLTVVGASMLWVGWFGFNAGSAVAADGRAGMAMLVTQVATATAALAWMFTEWLKHGKPSVLGVTTGAVAGLVAITPASGFVGPVGALAIGLAAGVVCFFSSTVMKRAFGYDDSLDAFGVHGVGGTLGAILTGIFTAAVFGGNTGGADPAKFDLVAQVINQLKAVGVTLLWSGIGSFVILKAIDATIGLRVDEQDETEGLDITQHDEKGYNF